MSGWDIDPPGVSGVVTRTKAVADDFDGQLTSIDTALRGGAAGSGSQLVASALSGFYKHVTPDIKFVTHRCSRAMTAAVKATNAYIRGDTEMAANAQRSATAAPPVVDLPDRRRPAP